MCIVKKAIYELEKIYKDDYICIKLNGLIQTTQSSVYRHIVRQLGIVEKGVDAEKIIADLDHGEFVTKPLIFIIYNFEELKKHCTDKFINNLLELPHITRPYINLNRLETIEDFKELIKNLLKIDNSLIPDANYCSMFNDKVQELLKTESFKKIIKQIFDFSADVIRNLSQTQIWILIAIKSLILLRDRDTFNFEIVYDACYDYVRGHTSNNILLKEHIVLAEYEFLHSRGLLEYVADKERNPSKRLMMSRVLLLPNQISDIVDNKI
ncbi:2570_t:CDS:2 [Entrophospora sp. SA101]|nr:1200_t:CDS:2 [Entrophospora sp. SA101]CAJ0900987.1 2570_t:CDS:2 [Entrophospora sp. SA101]